MQNVHCTTAPTSNYGPREYVRSGPRERRARQSGGGARHPPDAASSQPRGGVRFQTGPRRGARANHPTRQAVRVRRPNFFLAASRPARTCRLTAFAFASSLSFAGAGSLAFAGAGSLPFAGLASSPPAAHNALELRSHAEQRQQQPPAPLRRRTPASHCRRRAAWFPRVLRLSLARSPASRSRMQGRGWLLHVDRKRAIILHLRITIYGQREATSASFIVLCAAAR
jgi:hypothetical protein